MSGTHAALADAAPQQRSLTGVIVAATIGNVLALLAIRRQPSC